MSFTTPSEWDPPEHISLSEREFLVDRAETINGIIAQSYLKVGQVLLQVKRQFAIDPDFKGWFSMWIEECTPLSKSKGQTLAIIAEKVEKDPTLIDLTESVGYTALYKALLLPTSTGNEVLALMQDGQSFTHQQLEDVQNSPEVVLEAAQESAEELQMKLIELELEFATASPKQKLDGLNSQKTMTKSRLKKALTNLQKAKSEVESLEKSRSTLEILLLTQNKKLKERELQIENLTLDPELKRKRALAQTVVDATKGLDLLLSSIDRYGTDKPDLGVEAINTIERKMDEVKSKLLEHYADLSEKGGSS
jgi:hypothetical protein